jgi:hypothetical protein
MTAMNRTDLRAFLPGLYAVAGLLVIAPLADMVGAAWPLRPSDVAWRFGAIGLGMGVVLVQVLGLALAMGVAAALGHRGMLRLLSVVSTLLGGALIAGVTRFLLDYGELRDAMAATTRTGFDASTLRALIIAVLCAPVLIALGGRAWAAAKGEPEQSIRPEQMPVSEPLSRRRGVIPFPRHDPMRSSGRIR